jgi:hypothetical protein
MKKIKIESIENINTSKMKGITPFLIEAIKEQQKQIDDLKDELKNHYRIDKLNDKINLLEKTVKEQEKRLGTYKIKK